jgi:hypothetical protein
MPERSDIHHFLSVLNHLIKNRPLAPDSEDVAEYYSKEPSIPKVNEELTNWLPRSAMRLKFATVRQLLGENLTPSEVLNITEGN